MNKSLFALASGTFALGIAEFVIMAILSDIAGDVGITISEAGHLISAYALGVSVGAPFLLIVRKLPLKTILLILASLIMVGNLFAALASGYHALLAARFISGFPHGCYFGVGAIVAERISAPGKGAAAVSMVIAGMTLATTIGGLTRPQDICNDFFEGYLHFVLCFKPFKLNSFSQSLKDQCAGFHADIGRNHLEFQVFQERFIYDTAGKDTD